uniref:Uncharacterized protein LOC116955922 n=1 Tax=Petromyzon marinus TaxID=7757 RepID=A0AAJ7XG73_PETMA|nr:uncharacterized protein LOC116955922 [Petromyzon marinus]
MRRQYVEKFDKIQAEPCETKGAQDGAEEKIGMMTLEETSDKNVIMVLRHLQQIASNHKDIQIIADTYVDTICFAIDEFNHMMVKVKQDIIKPKEALEYFATQFPELDEKCKQIFSNYDSNLNELCNLKNKTQDEINNCKKIYGLSAIMTKQTEALANERVEGCVSVARKAGGVAVKSGCIGAAGGGTIVLSAVGAKVAGASAVAASVAEVAATTGAIIAGGAAVATGAALVAGGGALALGLGVKVVHLWSKRSEVDIQQEKKQWKATEAHFSQLNEQIIQIKGVIGQEKSCLEEVNLRLESIVKQIKSAKGSQEMVRVSLERQSKEVINLMGKCDKYKKLRMQTENTINPENAVCTTHRHNRRGEDC